MFVLLAKSGEGVTEVTLTFLPRTR